MGLINPPNKKKRKWPPEGYVKQEKEEVQSKKLNNGNITNGNNIKESNSDDYPIVKEYLALKESLSTKFKNSKLKRLREVLQEARDDATGLGKIIESTEYSFITKFLINYNATQSQGDLILFDILQFFDRVGHVDFKPIFPLVFGSNTAEHYQNLCALGRAIHICPKPNDILNTLDPTFLWNTGIRVNQFQPGKIEQQNVLLYDPRFVGYLLINTLDAGSEVKLQLFIERNGLSFGLLLLSAVDDNIRAIGYSILSDFLLKLKDISAENNFDEKPLLLFVLYGIRNNLKYGQKIPHMTANFFARCVKLILKPEDAVFSRIVSFFHTKFSFKLASIPEFYTMIMSTSSKTGLQERYWMMEIINESLLNNEDFILLENLNGISLLLSMFSSHFVSKISIKWTFFILLKMLKIPLAVKSLFNRYNFHTWVATTMHFKKLTRWECGFLTQIFVNYLTRVRKMLFEDEEQKRLKGAKKMKEKVLKLSIEKVLLILDLEEDDVWRKWRPVLEKLSGKWYKLKNEELDKLTEVNDKDITEKTKEENPENEKKEEEENNHEDIQKKTKKEIKTEVDDDEMVYV